METLRLALASFAVLAALFLVGVWVHTQQEECAAQNGKLVRGVGFFIFECVKGAP